METNQVLVLTETFEGHAQQTENGIEYWLARDLQYLLGYAKWDNFLNVLAKAKTACEVSGHTVDDHFADVGKLVDLRTIILKAKDFATEITIHNAREHEMRSEPQIASEHVTNNRAVRQTLIGRGIRPESLPPAEDVKKVQRRMTSDDKKALKNPDTLESP